MNRKSKVIVSIVGITIVLLALLGITYAYYLTRIEGNTNSNSISVTTADLKLVYGDGTTKILTKENIVPDNNNPVGTKDFSVTNTGNTTIDNYSVVLEYAVIDGVVPSVFKYPNDFEITLTCIDNKGNACNGTKINFNNEAVTLTTTSIDPNEVHNYTLEIYYRDSGIDQSDDMGKNLNLKVQIYEVGETIDINGTITGVDESYSVKLTSNPKISPIVKTSDGSYSYAFSGVEMGTHTLRVLNKDGEEVSNQKIVVQKGNSVGFSTTEVDEVEVPLITVNKDNRVISLTTNVNITNSIVTNSGTSVSAFNPYEGNKNSLAYNIINNAHNEKNDTVFSSIPLSKVAEEVSITAGTGEYELKEITNSLKPLGYSPWLVAATKEDATNGTTVSSCSQILEKGGYVYDRSGIIFGIFYVEDCSENDNPIANLELIDYEKVLSITPDNHGTSYYYRGNVEDNYVNFAGMCWRIVRIQGDGSVKLILEDTSYECDNASFTGNWSIGTGNYGYDNSSGNSTINYLEPVTNSSSSMVKSFYDFQVNKLSGYLQKLKSGNWCLDDNVFSRSGEIPNYTYTLLDNYDYSFTAYSDSYVRLFGDNKDGYSPTLKCTGTILNEYKDVTDVSSKASMYVATLTADEVVYAGGTSNKFNYNQYLVKSLNQPVFWLLTPKYYYGTDAAFNFYHGSINTNDNRIYTTHSFRPSISLASSVEIIKGDGTKTNPYIIK